MGVQAKKVVRPDSTRVDATRRLGQPRPADAQIGRDFGQRNQDEGPLQKAGMRQHETFVRQFRSVVEQKVDVDDPRPPAPGLRPPQRALGRLDQIEQIERRETCVRQSAGVDEIRLVGHPPGRGGVKRRQSVEGEARVAQGQDGAAEIFRRIAEIGAEAKADAALLGRLLRAPWRAPWRENSGALNFAPDFQGADMFGDVVDAEDRRPARKGAQMRGERFREPVFRRRAGQGGDETLARGADQHRQAIFPVQRAAASMA